MNRKHFLIILSSALFILFCCESFSSLLLSKDSTDTLSEQKTLAAKKQLREDVQTLRRPQRVSLKIIPSREWPASYGQTPEAKERPPAKIFPIQKRSPDKVIVAFTGGSVSMMTFEEAADTFIRTLKKNPRFQNKKFQMIGLAVDGGKQPEQLRMLTEILAAGAELDMVVNLDGYNEIALPLRYKIPPELKLHAAKIRAKRITLADLFVKFQLRRSKTATLVWNRINRRLEQSLIEINHEILAHMNRQREAASYREIARHWMRSSLLMYQISHANGIRYYHFLQPNQYVEGTKPLSEEEKRDSFTEDHPYRQGVEEGYPLLIENAKHLTAMGISFYDLTWIFSETTETIYADDCCHMNSRGHQILAAALAEPIAQHG